MYLSYEDYLNIYGVRASVTESDFPMIEWQAEQKINAMTTTCDGVKKLKVAYPTDEDAIDSIKHCMSALVDLVGNIQNAEDMSGLVEDSNGVHGKIVTSVNAGSESISYASGSQALDGVLHDKVAQNNMFKDIITEALTGVQDNNGVNLLYVGVYPYEV